MQSANVPPGLHFKWPIADSVKITDARVLTLDSQAERYYTLEKKPLIVYSFVKWRVADVVDVLQSDVVRRSVRRNGCCRNG